MRLPTTGGPNKKFIGPFFISMEKIHVILSCIYRYCMYS